MRFRVTTKVKGKPADVFRGFDRTLFEALTPPWATLRLIRFDGCGVGDRVELDILLFPFFRQHWENVIVAAEAGEAEVSFTDEGEKLPPPLKRWRHHHRIVSSGDGSRIVDDITYSSGWLILDLMMFPVVWLQFYYRRRVYRGFFGKITR